MKSQTLSVCIFTMLFTLKLQAGICDRTLSPFQSLTDVAGDREVINQSLLLSKEDRVELFCSVRQAMLKKYALVELKKERIGLDTALHLENCALAEAKIEDGDTLKFDDRVRKCVAAFQDTHLAAIQKIKRPWVYLPFLVKEAEGKIYISTVIPKILSYIKERSAFKDIDEVISAGNELVAIDDTPVEELIKLYEDYAMGSSPQARREWAIYYLATRSFLYPDKPVAKLKIRGAGGEVEALVPYFASSSTHRTDANAYLDKVGIKTTNWLKWEYNSTTNSWKQSGFAMEGFNESAPLYPTGLREYKDDDGELALRTGEILLHKNVAFCYMQLLTFSSKNLTENSTDAAAEPFLLPIAKFVLSCKQKELPLVFDLRTNPGGYGMYPAIILSLLAESGKSYAASITGFRNTPHVGWMLSRLIDGDPILARNLSQTSLLDLKDAYVKANQTSPKELHLDLLNEEKVSANSTIGGYKEKIVALISPNCVSACDEMANLLKRSGRATLIGQPTSGTGAGFLPLEISPTWSDNFDLYEMMIPNFLFGIAPVDAPFGLLPFAQYKQYLSENQPVEPDINYTLTVQDIRQNSAGLLKISLLTLFRTK